MLLAQAQDAPAGGAETSEAIIVTLAAVLLTGALVAPVLLYKSGRFPALGRLAGFAGRRLARYVELWDSASSKLSTGRYHSEDLVGDCRDVAVTHLTHRWTVDYARRRGWSRCVALPYLSTIVSMQPSQLGTVTVPLCT